MHEKLITMATIAQMNILRITNPFSPSDGVTGQEYPLTYNGAGSLESDAGRRIARIDYDMINNPIRIQFTNGNVTKYIYSAAGEKLHLPP